MFSEIDSRIYSSLAACVVAGLFVVELVALMRYFRARSGTIGHISPYPLMRPAIFLFLFSVDLCMAFIPLHMSQLSAASGSQVNNLAWLIGLPISAEFLCVGVAILIAGVWIDRSGWQPAFYVGVIFALVGMFLSWLAVEPLQFIVARGIVGFGYGLTALAAQGFVISCTNETNKSQGLAHLFAGLYSGSICGAALGATLAERYDYATVLFVSCITVLTVFVFALYFLSSSEFEFKKTASKLVTAHDTESASKGKWSLVGAYLFNPRIMGVILFSSLPASIAVVGFLNYFTPVYLDLQHVEEAAIGQILMLFGISLVVLGPWAGRLTDQWLGLRPAMLLGGLVGGLAFMPFLYLSARPAVIVSVLMLGLSNSLVLAAQSAYVLTKAEAKQLGPGKALGIFRSSSRIGQMLGPLLFAWVVNRNNIEVDIVWIGFIYVVVVGVLALMTSPSLQNQAVTSIRAHS